MTFPESIDRDEVLKRVGSYHASDLDWRAGKTFAYAYDPGREVEDLAREVSSQFIYDNALDPTAYPGLMRLENDLIAILVDHLQGDDKSTGTYTSGGTESIFLAVRSALKHGQSKKGITEPELVLPTTAHAAFHKAADYMGIKRVLVDVDPETLAVRVEDMAAAITKNTILLVGSAPSYGHGIIDPIAGIAALAQENDLLCHVDACVGGFLAPFWRELGADIRPCDFSVPGVTSISVDLHKYAFTPKGISFVMYRDADLRAEQIFACADWMGYSLVNPAVQSSRLGAPVAAAWAVMHHFGASGYKKICERMMQATSELIEGIADIPELEIIGSPKFSLLALRSNGPSVFHICDEMHQRGWFIHPQLQFRNCPENIHLSVYPNHFGRIKDMLRDLKEAVAAAAKLPELGQLPVDLSTLEANPELVGQLMEMVGVQGTDLPERMAVVNSALNQMSPSLRELLLSQYINRLYMPPA